MGVELSTARYLAPASFLYDFAAQQYGMFSSPNMKDIHDRNLSFFSPQPFFIAGKEYRCNSTTNTILIYL